ncbi:hypothetical protein B0O80DRAFT_431164 [Mortierella sp. GBAus27b]|nr:hypothetical protein B0O80DRAFT_431164 [Mortierella sp. GBAus27b]
MDPTFDQFSDKYRPWTFYLPFFHLPPSLFTPLILMAAGWRQPRRMVALAYLIWTVLPLAHPAVAIDVNNEPQRRIGDFESQVKDFIVPGTVPGPPNDTTTATRTSIAENEGTRLPETWTSPTTTTHAMPEMISPLPTIIDPSAVEPIFPRGSESCQKCQPYYPKLKECNQIANNTLALLPTDLSGSPGSGSGPGSAPPEFTTIMPFLQCICPNEGLLGVKVCMTCFRLTNQHNFLDQLERQNVSTSLKAFQQACVDSQNGTMIPPPPGQRDQSASQGHCQRRIRAAIGLDLSDTVLLFPVLLQPILTMILLL